MNIDKARVLAALRARGLNDRADWVDRQLPDLIDTEKNQSLLNMLGIDVAALAQAEAPTEAQARPE